MDYIAADATVLVQDYPAEGLDASKLYYQNDAEAFAQAAREQGIPAAICATLPENLDKDTRRHLISLGVAPMQGIHETLNAIRDAATWSERRKRIMAARPAPLLAGGALTAPQMLTEDAGKSWLSTRGVAVPKGRTATAKDAEDAAAEVGYPVALKMMSPHLAHKTEAGAVALGLKDAGALTVALSQMTETVRAFDPQSVTDSFLVETMLRPPLAEMIVTLRSDPQFGAALVLGSGGVLTELVGDAVTLLLPTTPAEIAEALKSLRVARLLNGFRGRDAADLDKVAKALHHLCGVFVQEHEALAEIEINPMFIYTDHIVAADALIHVTPQ